MEEEYLLWIKLANESIKRSLDLGVGCRTRRHWTAPEGLLLENRSIASSPHLRDLAKGLYEGRNSLCFEGEGAILPLHLTVEQLLILFSSEQCITP